VKELLVSESDWHLQAGSLCINAGTNDLAVGETDFYGEAAGTAAPHMERRHLGGGEGTVTFACRR
jgi:hypothetical protein